MNNMTLRSVLVCLALLLGSCVSRPPPRPPAPPPPVAAEPEAPADLHGATLFRIDAAQSTLHVLVYRGGALANLGHNHVISSTTLRGLVWWSDDTRQSGFELIVPVNEFIIDDNTARAAEGDEFPLNVSDDARTGTKRNLLSAALLDGAQYPYVKLKSVAVAGALPNPQVSFDLTLKDQTRRFTIPVEVEHSATRLRARGEFQVKQTDFGIKPFSAAMGALQVLDAVKIKFDLVANATE